MGNHQGKPSVTRIFAGRRANKRNRRATNDPDGGNLRPIQIKSWTTKATPNVVGMVVGKQRNNKTTPCISFDDEYNNGRHLPDSLAPTFPLDCIETLAELKKICLSRVDLSRLIGLLDFHEFAEGFFVRAGFIEHGKVIFKVKN